MSLWIIFFALIIFLLLSITIYNKLTCGICKSSAHMVGKVVIVTGANTGIGFETAKDLAERGAKVILACRNESLGVAACNRITELTGSKDVHYRHLDFSLLSSVREFVSQFLSTENRLDVLINNAGAYHFGYKKSEDGLLLGMQTNHFGPFLLTNLLLPILKKSAPSRIVNVSSMLYSHAKLDIDDLNMEKNPDAFSDYLVYSNSKLCNILMTVELHRRLQGTGVTTYSLHPGAIITDIMRNATFVIRNFQNLIVKRMVKTPWEGAQTTIHVTVSPDVTAASGRYFSDCKEKNVSKTAKDEELARKLWEKSAELVKLK